MCGLTIIPRPGFSVVQFVAAFCEVSASEGKNLSALLDACVHSKIQNKIETNSLVK